MEPKRTNLLLVDDDVALCELLADYLGEEGFTVEAVHDGENAVRLAKAGNYDVIILDVMLPQKGGFDVLRDLRRDEAADRSTPVLMLTARGEDVDRIVGLEMGADDYLPKPCNPRELVARLRAILRRTGEHLRPQGGGDPLLVDDIELREGERLVLKGSAPIELTSTEFSVLAVLLSHAGQVVSKELVSERALGRKLERYDRSIDMHVSRLRKKLGLAPTGESRIKTVRGTGYLYVRGS